MRIDSIFGCLSFVCGNERFQNAVLHVKVIDVSVALLLKVLQDKVLNFLLKVGVSSCGIHIK